MGLLLNYKYYIYNEFDDLEPSIEIVTPKFEALWYIIERRFEFRAAQYDDVSDWRGHAASWPARSPRCSKFHVNIVLYWASQLHECFALSASMSAYRAHIARWSARNFIHAILPKITNVNLSKTSAFL